MHFQIAFSYKKLLLFLIFFSGHQFIFSQSEKIEVLPKKYDFGEVIRWNNPPAIFTIVNKSKQPLVFLPTFTDQEIRLELPNKSIAPNATATVKVYYYTPLPGSFQRSIPLYVNISDQPIQLQIQGDILSLSPDALINCPDFSHKTFAQEQSFEQEIMVVNEKTKIPIPDVAIKILGNNEEYLTKTNANGKAKINLMIGLHDFLYGKEGFEPDLKIFYLNKNTGELLFTLKEDTTSVLKVEAPPIPIIATKVSIDENEKTSHVALQHQNFVLEENTPLILPLEKYAANNLVFLVDASGSMKAADKMPLLKTTISDLIESLRGIDKLSLITYAIESDIKFSGITADNKTLLKMHIDSLSTKGWTNGVKGLEQAYALAETHYAFNGNNQILLATDGLFNSPNYDENALYEFVKRKAQLGISLSIIGFGEDRKAVRMMKKLAYFGKGNYLDYKDLQQTANPILEEIKLHSQKQP